MARGVPGYLFAVRLLVMPSDDLDVTTCTYPSRLEDPHPPSLTLALGAVILAADAGGWPRPRPRRLSRAVLEDKIRGGWAGQMIGVSFGAPTEFKSNGKIIEGD